MNTVCMLCHLSVSNYSSMNWFVQTYFVQTSNIFKMLLFFNSSNTFFYSITSEICIITMLSHVLQDFQGSFPKIDLVT